MWDLFSVILLLVECAVLVGYIVGRIHHKRWNRTIWFLAVVFLINLALYLLPYLYRAVALKEGVNHAFCILKCFMSALQNFLGGIDTDAVADFAAQVPVFTYTYLFGSLLAVFGTVSAAVEAFSKGILNRFRLLKRAKQPICDVVLGAEDNARYYARSYPNTLLLLGEDTDKAVVNALIEEGFVVCKRNLTPSFLNGNLFNASTRYNFICPKETALDALSAFIAYCKGDHKAKKFHFYLEQEEEQMATLRRELVEKNGLEGCVTAFSSEELAARSFTERHPVTERLPKEWVEWDGSVKKDLSVGYDFLGYGKLSRAICRQSALNDQLVCHTGEEYRVLPFDYRIYDEKWEGDDWNLVGLKNALSRLSEQKKEYFPLPDLPFTVAFFEKSPQIHSTLQAVVDGVREKNTFRYIVVDTGDVSRNIETGARLATMLSGQTNYHMFVCADTDFAENSEKVTYYCRENSVYTHDVIVNESLSAMAKELNRVYVEQSHSKEKDRADFDAFIQKTAEDEWNSMGCFTIYSNLYAAVNLRLKLHLLGLDYAMDGKVEGVDLIEKHYRDLSAPCSFDDCLKRSKRSALLAQEHARWNAYHLFSEYLPLKKTEITGTVQENGGVKFTLKSVESKRHACLTTYRGLSDLSAHLAERATEMTEKPHAAAEFDYYRYDEMLLLSAADLLRRLGYSVYEKDQNGENKR